MRKPVPLEERIYCSHNLTPGATCSRWVGSNKRAQIHAIGWYFTRDGESWCPDHLPAFLTTWHEHGDPGVFRA